MKKKIKKDADSTELSQGLKDLLSSDEFIAATLILGVLLGEYATKNTVLEDKQTSQEKRPKRTPKKKV